MSKRKALTDAELQLLSNELDLDEESAPDDFSSDDSVADPLYSAENPSENDSSSEGNVGELLQMVRDEEEAEWKDLDNDNDNVAQLNATTSQTSTWTDYVERHKNYLVEKQETLPLSMCSNFWLTTML